MSITNYGELKTAIANELHRDDLSARIPEFIKLAEDWAAQMLRIRAMETQSDLVLRASTKVTAANLGGTADVITITNDTATTARTLGEAYSFTAEGTNTTNVTVNVDGVGAVALNKGDGTEALEANDLVNTQPYNIYYDGTRWRLVPRGGVPLPSRFVAMRRLFVDSDPIRMLKYEQPVNFYSRNTAKETSKPKIYTIEGEYIVFGGAPDSSYSVKCLYYRRFATLSSDSDSNWLIANAGGILLYRSLVEASSFLSNDPRILTWSALLDDLVERVQNADDRDRFSGQALIASTDVTRDNIV